MKSNGVKFRIDGKNIEAAQGTTVLQAALANKIDVPCFCYHPKLSIAGNCRMCLVQIKGQGKPVISCRETVREGMEVDTCSPEVKKMQQGVLEFILVNHPLDCPICDQSGECDLQDNYFKFSKFPSRLEDQKIHKPKVKPLGPLVTLDDERCIVCTRCVRFCDEVAGTHELCVTQRGGHSELTTYPGRELKNPYSLCTVDICPVGALTSTDFRFKKRVWFLKTTPSICTGCATGCNSKMDWDDSIVYRTRPRVNESVNQHWMCDEGRLTYKFINDSNRVLDPWLQKEGSSQKVSWEAALKKVSDIFWENSEKISEASVFGILSAQSSCEENFALYSFLKTHFPKVQFLVTGKEVESPTHDNFLMDADKNPNTKFLHIIKGTFLDIICTDEGEWCQGEGGGIYFVLDNLTESQKKKLVAAKPERIIWLTSNLWEPSLWADIVLPKPTFAEQDGTFINRQRRIQRAPKAFEPRGHSRPVWEILSELSKNLGGSWSYLSAEAVFSVFAETIAEFKNLNYAKIGDQGWNLD